MTDNRQSSMLLYRGSGWTQSKSGTTRPLSGDRSGSAQTTSARRIVPSNPVSAGSGGESTSSPTRPLRSHSIVTDRGQPQLSWLQNPRLMSAGKRTTINAPQTRGTSGRLRNIQARRAGEVPVAQNRSSCGVVGSPDGYRSSTEQRHSREGIPGGMPADSFHSFGILGMSVADGGVARGRSHTIVSSGVQGKGPSFSRQSSLSAVGGLDELQRAVHEIDPASKALVPGLMPMSVTPEGLIFCEAVSQPGEVFVQRTKAARGANLERLNLDRRNLKGCCWLLGEERLRLLNYQHNNITNITHLSGLANLVFLDLYSNNITDVSPLSQVTSLRVLMLGRNSVKKIQGLATLSKLDVLDLHNNLIETVEGLEGITGLRILNLAGNHVKSIANLSGLTRLAELNLRRNFISTVRLQGAHLQPGQRDKERQVGSAHLPPQLQRLFLSNNRIASAAELSPLGFLGGLRELALDNNPIHSAIQQREYRYQVLSRCPPQLRLLDLLEVTDDEKAVLSDAQRRREGQAAQTSSRGSSQDGWEDREDQEVQEPTPTKADSASFGYGISGHQAKLQQPEPSKQQAAQERVEIQKSAVGVAWNGAVSHNTERTQPGGLRRPESAAIRLGAVLAKRSAEMLDEKPSSLSAMLQDPRGFSGIPAELVSSHLSEMSQIWTEDIDSDVSSSDGETAEGTAGHLVSPADLLLARRKQQLQQVRAGPVMPADLNTSGFGAMGVAMTSSRPQSSRAIYTGCGTSVSRLYSAQPRASSFSSSRAIDDHNRAEGYAELVEGGTRLNVFGRATETLKQPSSFEAEEICITYLPCSDLTGVVPILGAMGKLRSLVLEENNLCYLHELDLIAPLSQVLRVDVRQGNPVASLELFRTYLLSRMPSLEAINGQLVKAEERAQAKAMFASLDRMRESKLECLASYQLPAPEGSSWSVATEAVDGDSGGGLSGGRSRVFVGGTAPGSVEDLDTATGAVVHQMLRECLAARESLDIFEEKWSDILADIVGDCMKAISY